MFRFDESDPAFLIAYSGAEEATVEDYRNLGERWIVRLNKGEPFGVIIVTEPHHHDEDHHREHEAEINRVINDFRRDFRDRTAKVNLGFARVIDPVVLAEYEKEYPGWTMEQGQEATDRYAQYNWGIPGRGFTSVEEAKAWLLQQDVPTGDTNPSATKTTAFTNQQVGLFYGSSTGVTEYIAEEIMDAWEAQGMKSVDMVNIGHVKNAADLLRFDNLILGIPTWNIGELQDDWDILFPQLESLDFSGKRVAIFGIGDQYGYPDNFLDAVGILGKKLRELGAELVGHWFDEHYEFAESVGFENGKFMGLGIDDVSQAEFTDERIQQWVAQIIAEFNLQPAHKA